MLTVQMNGITKRFPGVIANDAVDLCLYPGEIHGLLGENGAGKTTLMNILFGLYRPDNGQILIRDKIADFRSPADAIQTGIGMVHQHYKLVPPFTVTENVILGLQGAPFINLKTAQQEVAEVAHKYGLDIDLSVIVQQLSVGEQQRVEILCSLFRGAEVLILDEPTAVLTPQESDSLAVVLRSIAREGKSIVFISHKLEEVLRLTDRVTVLHNGRVVFNAMTRDTNKAELARKMIGREFVGLGLEQRTSVLALAGDEDAILAEAHAGEVAARTQPAKDITGGQEIILRISDLHVNDDRGLPAVRGINLEVNRGHILGIAGVDGNGQRELAESIIRLREISSGQVIIRGQDTSNWKTRDFFLNNVSYITDDRQNEGLILDFDLSRNATLKLFDREPFSNHGLLNFNEIIRFTRKLIEAFDVRAAGHQVRAKTLSGGNQQKMILARELSITPDLIIANKPTRGLDIGAAAYIHQKLNDERSRRAGILLISADLDEILLLSDRILVMFNGQSMGVVNTKEADIQSLGLMMAGTSLSELSTEEVSA